MTEMTVTVPTDLNEIPLFKYLRYAHTPEDASAETRNLTALRIFVGLDSETVQQASKHSLNRLLSLLNATLGQNPHFTPRFKHAGIEWGFIPNLDDMTMGEYIDLDNIKDYKIELAKLMSILYRPVVNTLKGTYQIAPYDAKSGNHKLLENMPTGIALGALVFFWTIGNDCLNYTLKSILKEVTQKRPLKRSGKSGVGLVNYTASLRETYSKLKELRKNLSLNAYYGLPMSKTWLLLTAPNKGAYIHEKRIKHVLLFSH